MKEVEILERLEAIEKTLQTLVELVSPEEETVKETVDTPEGINFGGFTAKQHCAMQMLLNGKSNKDIAERFGITTDTAKVHVRTIFKKMGVNTRSQVVMKALKSYNEIDDSSYRIMTGGLPKDWDATWSEPDPFRGMYKYEKGSEVK